MRKALILCIPFIFAACAELQQIAGRPDTTTGAGGSDLEVAPVVTPELAAPPPSSAATTVEDFDTTTEEQRIAAASVEEGGRLLGQTVASLGDPGRAGFWIETDLADAQGRGRLVNPATGASVEVELLPLSGDAGSRVSLAALRILGVSLTDLPTLDVYAF